MPEIHKKLEELGIDKARLKGVLDSNDNWGKLVHAFEALTVMGVVLDAWPDGEAREFPDHNPDVFLCAQEDCPLMHEDP